jgi:hypothetical protein
MDAAWTPRRQGDFGELSAINWLTTEGAFVFIPLFSHPDYDVIADFGSGGLVRVQVKTSGQWQRNRFIVSLCTRGGNQSWNGIVKRMDASRCDHVFIHVSDGRRWYIPASDLGGTTSIALGGPKYAEFEVERGPPLPARQPTQLVHRR